METSAQVGRGERRRKGSLTIFAGYFSGTGKTYRMLEAAGRAVRAGEDVAVGLALLQPMGRRRRSWRDGFETLPLKAFSEAGKTVYELDVDACLKRGPRLLLIDELSHENAGGSRHRKPLPRILKNCCRQGLISIRRWMYSTLRVFRTPFPKFWALRPRSGFRTGCSIRPRAWNSWTVNRKTCGNA